MSEGHVSKPPLQLSEQVALLESRGMVIPDQEFAESTLLRINYYRLSGYGLHYEVFEGGERTHKFRPGTTFDQVVALYEFDSRLRALLFRYIEPVEVAFRTALCYEVAIRTGNPHWYLDRSSYTSWFDYDAMCESCQREFVRSEEVFIQSYKAKYVIPALPPMWMMIEIVPLGVWSKVYSALTDREAGEAVASLFRVKPYFLRSWIHTLTVLRNLCAHHCRLVHRTLPIRPDLPSDMRRYVSDNGVLAAQILVLTRLLEPLGNNADLEGDLSSLLAAYPDVCRQDLGFALASEPSRQR